MSDDKVIETGFRPRYFTKNGIQALREGREILELNPFPKDAIEDIPNIWFENEEETKDWLKSILDKLEAKIKEAELKSS